MQENRYCLLQYCNNKSLFNRGWFTQTHEQQTISRQKFVPVENFRFHTSESIESSFSLQKFRAQSVLACFGASSLAPGRGSVLLQLLFIETSICQSKV